MLTGGNTSFGHERELGPHIAHAVEQLFEFERRGTVWREKEIAPSSHKAVTGEETNIAANKAGMTYGTLDTKSHRESEFVGDWDTTIATPVGKLEVKLSISTSNGMIQGNTRG